MSIYLVKHQTATYCTFSHIQIQPLQKYSKQIYTVHMFKAENFQGMIHQTWTLWDMQTDMAISLLTFQNQNLQTAPNFNWKTGFFTQSVSLFAFLFSSYCCFSEVSIDLHWNHRIHDLIGTGAQVRIARTKKNTLK